MTPRRPDAAEVIRRAIEPIEELELTYQVGGSYASSIHGVPRQTHDLDLVVALGGGEVMPLYRRWQTDFYADDEKMRDAVRRCGSFNLVHHESGLKIDVFVAGGGDFDRSELDRSVRLTLPIRSEPMPVKSAEDTVLRKLDWYRRGGEVSERQWRDVVGVLRVQGDRLDRQYLGRWAAVLGVRALLDRAERDAGQ